LKWLQTEVALLPDEAIDRQVFEDNITLYSEAIAIHKWWHHDRKSEYLKLNQKQDQAYTREMKQEVYAEWDAFEAKEDEMLQRLIKIRMGLWN
jgi:hypothetical protein